MSLPASKRLNFPIYGGLLDRKAMSKDERFGYEAYNAQKARSKKANHPAPSYSAREFIGWWLHNLKTFKGEIPTCGRIDHSKGYSWENIEMQCMRDNSREGILRNNIHMKTKERFGAKLLVKDKKTKEIIDDGLNIREVARKYKVSQRLVQKVLRGEILNSKKLPYSLELKHV